MTVWVAWLAMVLTAALSVAAAGQEGEAPAEDAQRAPVLDPSKRSGPDDLAIYAEFGWGKLVGAERWSPVTLWVSAGEKPLGGWAIMRFAQDATQTAEIAVSYATTPGQATPVRFTAAFPEFLGRVEFELRDGSGRVQRQVVYSGRPTFQEAQLPIVEEPVVVRLATVGRASLGEAVRAWRESGTRGEAYGYFPMSEEQSRDAEFVLRRNAWHHATRAASAKPDELPPASMAYDSLAAVIAEGGAAGKAEPRAIEALHEWVRGGGRLVVVATEAGEEWRQWLPREARGWVAASALVSRPVPGEIGEILGVLAAARPLAKKVDASADPSDGSAETPEDQFVGLPPELAAPDEAPAVDPARLLPVDAAGSVPARRLTIDDEAAERGWTLRWKDGDSSAGMLAEGPVGLGWVTVIGVEPRLCTELVSARALGAIWRAALARAVEPAMRAHVAQSRTQARVGRSRWWNETPSPLRRTVEAVGMMPAAGNGAFIVIAAALGLMAALVGPIDFFVLRRLGWRQHSWLTALAWIGLASLGAYIAPTVVRNGANQVVRAQVTDVLVEPEGLSRSWTTGVTALFANQSGRVELRGVDAGSWWHGVSPVSYARESAGTTPTVVTRQQTPTAGEFRGNPLESIDMGLWTLRTFTDRGSAATPIRATAAPTGQPSGEAWDVTVTGLRPGLSAGALVLRVGPRWYWPADVTARRVGADGAVSATVGEWYLPRAGLGDEARAVPFLPPIAPPGARGEIGLLVPLAGAGERGATMDALAATGRYAVVYVMLRDEATPLGPSWSSAAGAETTLVRCVVRLDARVEWAGE